MAGDSTRADVCNCSLTAIQRRYTPADYKVIDDGIRVGMQLPAEFVSIVADCKAQIDMPRPASLVAVAEPAASAASANVPSSGTGFEGHDLELEQFKGAEHLAGPYHVTVGPGARFANLAIWVTAVSIAVTNDSLQFDFSKSAPPSSFGRAVFNGYVFRTSPGTPAISTVTVDKGATNMPIDASRLAVTTDSIRVNFQGLDYNTRSAVKFIVAFAP
jgi:hypothetical protein